MIRLPPAAGVLLLALCGCQVAPRAISAQPTVTHVVVCWLKNPDDTAAEARIIEVSQSFKSIPGVLDVRVGRMLPSSRPIVDSSYDIAIVIDFTSERALREYDAHPLHKRAVQSVLMPAVKRIQVYDFVAAQ